MLELCKFDQEVFKKAIEWHSDPGIVSLLNGTGSIDHSPENVRKGIAAWAANPSMVLIGLKTKNEIVGYIMLSSVDYQNHSAELHVILDKKYWRGGYGVKAFHLAMDHVFNKLKFNRLQNTCYGYRADLIAIMERNTWGSKLDGILREAVFRDDKYYDIHVYSILKKDFIKEQ